MTVPGGRDLEPANPATVTGLLAASEFGRGDLVAGRFRIERLLGMGGMGLVYLARDEQLGVDVALKLLRPELAARPDAFDRFRQELLLARQVSSPHVVRIHDLVQHGSVWLLSMDFVPGRSLQQLLDERGTLPPQQAIDVTRQIALGLAAAHQRGVIHRDLKPANILITDSGDALITDFGVARSAGATGLTLSGTIVGTPEYLSPEQARAEPTDGRSDLYALGLILHEMLTGTVPFAGGTPAEMLAQRIVRSPPPVHAIKPDLPPLAAAVCNRLLEVRPARRPPDAMAVVRAIEAGRMPGAGVGRRRNAGVVLALLLIAATLVGIGWMRWEPAPPSGGEVSPGRLQIAVVSEIEDESGPAAALARGLELELGLRLIQTGQRAADPNRVQRALDELDLPRTRVGRMRSRLAATLDVSDLLVLTSRTQDGRTDIAATLWRAGSGTAAWSERVALESGSDAGLAAWWTRLAGRLDLDPNVAPDAAALEAAARVAPGSALEATVAAPVPAASPQTWWQLMERLERDGRGQDARRIAREAMRVFAAAPTPAAARVHAMARYLVGDAADALSTLDARGLAPFDAPARILRARILVTLGRYGDAERELRGVVALDERNLDAWFLLGKTLLMQGEAQAAMDDALTRSLVGANRLRDRRMQAEIANAMGIGFRQLGQLDPAAEQFRRAVALREEIDDARGLGVSLRNLAAVLSIQGDFEQAAALLSQARARLEPLGDSAALADLQNDVGLLAEERGDFRAALAAYREALAFLQVDGDVALVAESQLNVGFSYFQLGEFDNAQVFLQQAAAGYRAIDDKAGAIRASQGERLLQIARGEFAAARTGLRESLVLAQELQMQEEQSAALAALAELDRLEGHYADALRGAQDAARLFEQRGDARGVTEMRLLAAAVELDLGAAESARRMLSDIDAAALGNREQLALYHLRQAEIALQLGILPEALASAARSVDLAVDAGAAQVESQARLARARILAASGRRTEARAELSAAARTVGRFPSVALRLAQREAELEVEPAASAYLDARGLLSGLTSYGREWRIAALARRAALSAPDAEEARRRAEDALARTRTAVPPERLERFERFVASEREGAGSVP